MLLEPPEGRTLAPFFRALKGHILARWQSAEGFAYDRVQYAVRYPYAEGDLERVLAWAGHPGEQAALPPLDRLNRTLTAKPYPQLAPAAPKGVSAPSWSALLHFLDPSYPLATDGAFAGLRSLGFAVGKRLEAANYGRFLSAVDTLKDAAPAAAVPETNWYLARVIQVGLEEWGRA